MNEPAQSPLDALSPPADQGQYFSHSSTLPIPAAELLATLNFAGVNYELGPWVQMSAPPSWASQSITAWPVDKHLFTSWITLFGLVPIDRHHFRLRGVDPASGFVECSQSWNNRYWHHARRIQALPQGCRVIDTVHYRSRLLGMGWLLKPVYQAVFAWRHRQLRKKHGRLA
jgi:hypothetical protein